MLPQKNVRICRNIILLLEVACANPPIPDPSKNIFVNYTSGTTVPFNSGVPYTCLNGYFFENDYNMTGFHVTCLPNGTWTPLPNERCIHPNGKDFKYLYYRRQIWLIKPLRDYCSAKLCFISGALLLYVRTVY